jgi:hypothetical protein
MRQQVLVGLHQSYKRTEAEEDEYRYTYVLDFECERNDTSVIIRSGWI